MMEGQGCIHWPLGASVCCVLVSPCVSVLQVVFQKQAPVAENKPDIAAMLASASGEKPIEDDTPEMMRKPFQFLSVQLLR